MPCYNAMPYLPEALESIMHQTYTNLEILCINDGSTDETAEVLERYAKQDQRIRVVHNETNLKLIATLNKGVRLAQGEYIARMDADDVALADRIEEQLNVFGTMELDFVGSNFIQINDKGLAPKLLILRGLSNEEIAFCSYFFTPFVHPTVLGKSTLFKKLLYAAEDYALHTEDYELWTRLVFNEYNLRNINIPLLKLRVNAASVSHKHESIQITNFIYCANKHQRALLKRDIPLETSAVAVNRLKNPQFRNVRSGFRLLDEIKTIFIQRYPECKQSIKSIAVMQKADITIQLVKLGAFKLKIYGFFYLVYLFVGNYHIRNFRKHLFSKI